MTHCIVCGGRTDDSRCPRCGFDLSLDRESYPTLSPDSRESRALWALRDEIFCRQRPRYAVRGGELRTNAAPGGSAGQASPRETPSSPDLFRIRPNGDGSCSIVGLAGGCPALLVVPGQINGLRVTEIGTQAMMGEYELFSVVLPDSIAAVGAYAFYGCRFMQKLRLPDGIEIRGKAFGNCPALMNVFFTANGRDAAQRKHEIAEDAFSAHHPDMKFYAPPGSPAASYAARKGIRLRLINQPKRAIEQCALSEGVNV